MKKIKLGLIGAGWVANKHLEVIKDIDWMEAVGITSRTKAKAQKLANDYNIPFCTDDLGSLVKEAKPDALMVLVSEDQIYKVTADIFTYKLPLFIEKPSGLTPQENLELINLSKKYSVVNMVGYNRRFYSIFHKGIEIIRNSGKLFAVAVEGHERMWRVRESGGVPKEILDNWIFASSTHTTDLLRFFGGEANDIKSISRNYSKEAHGDQFTAIMNLSSGAIGQYNAFWYSPGGWTVKLFGEGVTVEFKPLEAGRWIDKKFQVHEIEPDKIDTKYKVGFFKQMEAFGELVRSNEFKWPMLDLEGAYKTMLLTEQMCSNVFDKTALVEG